MDFIAAEPRALATNLSPTVGDTYGALLLGTFFSLV